MKEITCPRCSTLNRLDGRLKVFYCNKCGAKVKITKDSISVVDESRAAAEKQAKNAKAMNATKPSNAAKAEERPEKSAASRKWESLPDRKKLLILMLVLMLAGAAIFFMALGGPLPSGFVTPGYLLFFIAAAIGFGIY
ncbi:MAG: hypothetical protein II739_04355 [Clostridia bacterium]|nr:hypothetical protein [Clostridia bacterium]